MPPQTASMHRPVWHCPLDAQEVPSSCSGVQLPAAQKPELSHGALWLQAAPSAPLATQVPATQELA